jgi:hypothetical protein
MSTTPRQLLEKAREALQTHQAAGSGGHTTRVIAAIDAHLSEPEASQAAAQPVATILRQSVNKLGRTTVLVRWGPGAMSLPDGEHTLYAAPPSAQAKDAI